MEAETKEVTTVTTPVERPAVTPLEPATPEVNPDGPEVSGVKPAEAAVSPPVDLSVYAEEISKTGDLSEASLVKLSAELGTTPEVARYTLEGMKATRRSRDEAILEAVGGAEVFSEVTGWASEALPATEVEAFNNLIKSGTKEELMKAAVALRNKFTAVNGSPQAIAAASTAAAPPVSPPPSQGSPQQVYGVQPYADISELMAAQRDPRYCKDTRYTQEVYQRANLSKF